MQTDFLWKQAINEKLLEELNITKVIIPQKNHEEEIIEKEKLKKIKIIECNLIEKKESYKKKDKITAINCKNPNDCMWAASSKTIDMIIQPFTTEKNFIDRQTAEMLAKNEVFTAILFSEFLEKQKQQRQLLMKNAMQSIKLLEKTKAKTLIFSGAKNQHQIRAPKDLVSFLITLGMKKENAIKTIKENTKKLEERLT
ncbi:MAG: RNase P subunit p30 family protein [Candidatus Diapherotrites archaeon]